MQIDQLNQVISRLQQALDIVEADYKATNDILMRKDGIVIKVALTNMQKRRSNAIELAYRTPGDL